MPWQSEPGRAGEQAVVKDWIIGLGYIPLTPNIFLRIKIGSFAPEIRPPCLTTEILFHYL
jgi:hypothetical protein